MKGETGERWRWVCEQAAQEHDPEKLMRLIEEINQLLESKEERLLRGWQEQEAKTQSGD